MIGRAVLLGTWLLLLAACASVDTDQTTRLNAVVETVDPVSRELLVRGDAGAQSGPLVSMLVGSHVTRLNEVHAGDRVTVTYYQGLAAKVVSPFDGSNPPSSSAALYRNDTAERPGGEFTRVRSGRVTITAVDPASATVSFVGPDHLPHTVAAKNPEVANFVRQLHAGQQVDMVYEEALAIAVEPIR